MPACAAVLIKEGRVADIALLDDDGSNLTLAAYSKFSSHQIDDYGDLIVSPGLIDTHVHLNEPGREHWEGRSSVPPPSACLLCCAVVRQNQGDRFKVPSHL